MACYEDIVYENGELKCILCEVTITDNNDSIDAHIYSFRHKELYKTRLLLRNSMQLQSDTIVSCLICHDYNIDVFKLDEHIRSDIHHSKMKELQKLIMKDGSFIELPENEENNKVNCLICNRDYAIMFTLTDIMNHISSDVHKRARSIAVQPFNGIFSVEGSNEDLWCKICRVYFDNYIESIFIHVDDDPHVTNLTKLLKLIDGQNISIENFLVDPKQDKARCNKCQTEVACNLDNLERHIKGKGKGKHNGSV